MTVIERHFRLNATKFIRGPQIGFNFDTEFEVKELNSKQIFNDQNI